MLKGKRFVKEYVNYIIKRNREINYDKPMIKVDSNEAKISKTYNMYINGIITETEVMHWLADIDMGLWVDDEQELNLSIKTYDGEQKYMKIWFSDNEPCDNNNTGCIGISVFNDDLKEIDGGELDYKGNDIKLIDMIDECIKFMNINPVTVGVTNINL